MKQAVKAALRRMIGRIAVPLWAAVVVMGMAMLVQYKMTPGRAAAATLSWPSKSTIGLATDRPTLLMFVHPSCPCSQASIEELARAMARCDGQADARVVFHKPDEDSEQISRSSLWHNAARIPGVSVMADSPDGSITRTFGAYTSGQVLLFSQHGRLLFSGGITASRGHAGDNPGLDRILSLIPGPSALTQSVAASSNPVFGCSIDSTLQESRP